MKMPKPWYWKARKAWYVQLDGKQIRLHEKEREAYKEYHRIMADQGTPDGGWAARMSAAEAAEALIASMAHARPSTRRLYEYNLGPFAAQFRHRRLEQIRPDEIIRFVAGFQGRGYKNRTFGDPSRYLMFRYIKTLYRWARDTGIVRINTLHGTDNPWKSLSRPRAMTEDEYRTIMADRRLNERFKEVLEFLWKTGARPGEIARLEARHLDAKLPIARLKPAEHKTGAKTGLQREIVFPPDLMERLRRYAQERPDGALLRNRKGNPWTTDLISDCFGRVKRRLGLPGELVIYMARHSFITRLLAEGRPAPIVAKIAGHTHAETIQRVYYHPDTEAMIRAVGEINVGEGERPGFVRGDEAREGRGGGPPGPPGATAT